MFRFEITVLSSVSSGDVFRFTLDDARTLSIGRGGDNDVVVYDPKVSKYHASIEVRDGEPRLIDLESTHGSWLMGFEVEPGSAGVRIESGDEFKIGDTLFKAHYETVEEGSSVKEIGAGLGQLFRKKASSEESGVSAWKKQRLLLIALCAFLLIALLIWPEGRSSSPRQVDTALHFGLSRVLGYYPQGRSRNFRDIDHLRSVRFSLPVSDQLIEYQFLSESPVAIFVGDHPSVRMPARKEIWQRWMLIVRDAMSGKEQDLLFENIDNKKGARRHSRWGLWNVRNTPLSQSPLTEQMGGSEAFERAVYSAAELAETLGGDPHSLHAFLRALQRLLVLALADIDHQSLAFPISMESFLPLPLEMRKELIAIAAERKSTRTELMMLPQTLKSKHLELLLALTAKVDAELWRIYNSRVQKAKLAAKASNYTDALRNLVALRSAFSDEEDYRWQQANALLHNKKIVPAKVLKHADRYLTVKASK